MPIKDNLSKSGEFIITIKDLDGNIQKRMTVPNQLTWDGQLKYMKILAKTLSPFPSSNNLYLNSFELGTDNTPADIHDGSLGASVWSKNITSRSISATPAVSVSSAVSVGSDELNGTTICEVGAFLADGTMWARTVFTPIEKNENMILDIERIDKVIYY